MADLVEEKQHARLSPSATKRWMTCPGSIGLTEKLNIVDKPSKYAAEGTVAHEVHELCLIKNQDAIAYKGKTIESDGFKFKVNQDMVDSVQLSLDYIRDRIAMAETKGWTVKLKVEVRCSLESYGIPGMDGGTSDVILEFWDMDNYILMEVEVFDYKHGAGVAVEAVDNTQAMSYALGTILLPELNGQGIPDGITVTISQPRAHHPDGRIRSWRTDKDHLLNWGDDILVPAALATMDKVQFHAHAITAMEEDWKEPVLVPSDDGCRFCPVAGQCPKLFTRTQEVAMLDFADDDAQLPEVDKLTSKQKQFIMDHATMLRAFIVAVENQVKLEVDQGSKDYEEAYKLVRKTTRRKFTEDALDELCSPLLDHLEHSDVYEEKSRSMTEIERRLKKAIGVKDAKEVMGEITMKPEGELVIAPISDKRKAANPTMISDFTDL